MYRNNKPSYSKQHHQRHQNQMIEEIDIYSNSSTRSNSPNNNNNNQAGPSNSKSSNSSTSSTITTNNLNSTSIISKRWTSRELQKLTELIRRSNCTNKERDWESIPNLIGGKKGVEQVKRKWYVLSKSLENNNGSIPTARSMTIPWTSVETVRLRREVERYDREKNARDWDVIASRVGNERTKSQCSNKWTSMGVTRKGYGRSKSLNNQAYSSDDSEEDFDETPLRSRDLQIGSSNGKGRMKYRNGNGNIRNGNSVGNKNGNGNGKGKQNEIRVNGDEDEDEEEEEEGESELSELEDDDDEDEEDEIHVDDYRPPLLLPPLTLPPLPLPSPSQSHPQSHTLLAQSPVLHIVRPPPPPPLQTLHHSQSLPSLNLNKSKKLSKSMPSSPASGRLSLVMNSHSNPYSSTMNGHHGEEEELKEIEKEKEKEKAKSRLPNNLKRILSDDSDDDSHVSHHHLQPSSSSSSSHQYQQQYSLHEQPHHNLPSHSHSVDSDSARPLKIARIEGDLRFGGDVEVGGRGRERDLEVGNEALKQLAEIAWDI